MLVSRTWKATISSFPSLRSKLIMAHRFAISVGNDSSSGLSQKFVCYDHVDVVAELLPRISQLVIAARGGYGAPRLYHAFSRIAPRINLAAQVHPTTEVVQATRIVVPAVAESWPALVTENLTRIHLDSNLDPEAWKGI